MRLLISLLLAITLFSNCTKYADRKVEGVWLLQRVNVCYQGSCLDMLEDRGIRDQYDKIELRLTRGRDAEGRFYQNGVLEYKVPFEYILDEKMGRISFIGPDDVNFPNFFGGNVSIEELSKSEMVYIAIEDFPDDETVYIYSRLQ